MDFLVTLLWAAGFAVFLFGLQTVLLFPLTVVYEVWKKRFFRKYGDAHRPSLSVIVPVYNEEKTIVPCLESILESDYPSFEVIVVNDGSTDGTERLLAPFIESGKILYLKKPNGGKASALNAGIARSRGEVVFFTDADSLFRPDTLSTMARWFVDKNIHAVCGNDTPVSPENSLQRLLAVTTHIGTGFVRRALSVLNVMPIISGNSGAVRKEYLEKVGGFSEVWGEDLDLTFKLHKARARIVYDSDSLVLCDVPRTVRDLWKQRVRWTRSYIKIASLHADLMFSRNHFPFSWYLPVNWFNLIGIPLLQILTVVALPFFVAQEIAGSHGILKILAFLGYGMFFGVAVYSVILDRAPRHLLYVLLYGWLIVPVTYFYNAVVLHSLYCEFLGRAERWEKVERREISLFPALRATFGRVAADFLAPAMVLVLLFLLAFARPGNFHRQPASAMDADRPLITVATHFDAWEKPGDALTSVLTRGYPDIITNVAVGAGRLEWNFFGWKGHEDTWSNDQRYSGGDLLADAVRMAGETGKRVVSIIDFYGPLYARQHPDDAARDVDGVPSSEQICFTELVHGDYGRRIKEMVTYMARSYDIEAINLTELEYSRYCYDDRCLESFRQETGSQNWPRGFFSGQIDRTSRSVGAWRSKLMANFLLELADSAHVYGKKLYVDVPIDYDNLEDEGLYTGLHYPELVPFVDGLVVWDYFYLEGRSPATSEDVAKFFVDRYGAKKVIISIGLWGKDKPVSPEEMTQAVTYARFGGAQALWITPNHLLTPTHWSRLTRLFEYTPLEQP